MLRKR